MYFTITSAETGVLLRAIDLPVLSFTDLAAEVTTAMEASSVEVRGKTISFLTSI